MQPHFLIHSIEMFYKKEISCQKYGHGNKNAYRRKKFFCPIVYTCTLYIHKGHNVVDRHTVN